jgi:nucleoside-diphosphate-sugar epimerase
MRVLFIGGTGLISSAVSPLILDRGHNLTLINRGMSPKADPPAGASVIHANAHDSAALREALAADVTKHGRYDAVVQWVCFSPEHIAQDIETFAGLTDQYVFISSASAYQTPPAHFLTTESTPLDNPYWQYSRDKAACEQVLRDAGEATGFPFTIVRPSHTYGYSDIVWGITSWPKPWTIVDRILAGKRFITHGDGTSLWTVTDHRDFAVGIVGLLGHPQAIGEAFHITSDDVLTWNQIHTIVAGAVGISAEAIAAQTVVIPSDLLVRFDREAFEGPLLGDKTNAGVFDNSKIKACVPDFATRYHFVDSIHESVEWFRADASRRGIDDDANALWDRIIDSYTKAIDAIVA